MKKVSDNSIKKIGATIGGFLILAGTILLGLAALYFFGYLHVGLMFQRNYVHVFAIMLIVIGLLDTLVAMVIARW